MRGGVEGLGTWSGNAVVSGGGALGREPGQGRSGNARERRSWAAEAPPRGRTAAGPVIPLATRPGPAQRQWLGESAPASSSPRPRATPNQRPETELERLPHPGLASPIIPPSGWLSGPWAPHRRGSGNLPRPVPRPGPAPPSLQSPQPFTRPDLHLLLESSSPFPLSPPPPAWTPVGGRGGCAPCAVPSPPPP